MIDAKRGEIWEVRFDPSEGDEIKKARPAVVMSVHNAGRMNLRIVVPITGWNPRYSRYFWMVRLEPSDQNGLSKESAADTVQVKSLSLNRFQHKLGSLPDNLVNRIAAAIMVCVGYTAPVKK